MASTTTAPTIATSKLTRLKPMTSDPPNNTHDSCLLVWNVILIIKPQNGSKVAFGIVLKIRSEAKITFTPDRLAKEKEITVTIPCYHDLIECLFSEGFFDLRLVQVIKHNHFDQQVEDDCLIAEFLLNVNFALFLFAKSNYGPHVKV